MNKFNALIETFSDDSGIKGSQFEKLSKWYFENDPKFKSKIKKVWLWDDWPGRWGRDTGIDLIAQDKEDKIWAIQAKCYLEKYSVTKHDVDKFLAESVNTKIHRRILITTTDRLGLNAVGVIERQNKVIPVNKIMLTDLRNSTIQWPKDINRLTPARKVNLHTPLPYQKIAIKNISDNLTNRGQLVMACGTGKTLVALWIAEKIKSETTLILLPSLLLLSKTLSEWTSQSKEPFAYLPVCSDETVTKGSDSISLSSSDLSFPSTTDPKEIGKFIKKPGKKVIFSTYQSSSKISDAFKSRGLKPFDLIICDEAHRCAGKVESHYSINLDNKKIPAKKRLFMTATPRIYQSAFKEIASKSGIEIASMDDEKIFGSELHKLSFGEAIKKELLTDYQVVVVGIDNITNANMIQKRKLIKTDSDIETDAMSLAANISLAKAMKKYKLRKIISFHNSIDAAKDFSSNFPEIIEWMPKKERPKGLTIANHVDGNMTAYRRSKNLNALASIEKNQNYLLSNARCLSEGIDIPSLDGIAFIDPRNSKIDIIQAVGRAIRLDRSGNKEIGTIVIPVYINNDNETEDILEESQFKKVWSVINALRAHDQSLANELDQLRFSLGKKGKVGKKIPKIIFDIPTSVNDNFESSLRVKLVEATSQKWEYWFGLLSKYQEEYGGLEVPARYRTSSGERLGQWVDVQRRTCKDQKRRAKLNAINFIWDILEFEWDRGYQQLKKYYLKNSHSLVPVSYRTPNQESFNLGGWVHNQRTRSNGLNADKKKKLKRLNFVWHMGDYHWKKNIEELSKFFKNNNHSNVPSNFISSKIRLGNWVVKTRNRAIELDSTKIKELNKFSFIWDINENYWNQAINELKEYIKQNGNSNVPQLYLSSSSFNLGNWLSNARASRRKGTLSRKNIIELEGFNVQWSPDESAWEHQFNLFKEYKKRFNTSRIKLNYVTDNGISLGRWAGKQRTIMRNRTISIERAKKLNAVGFIWSVR